MLPAGDQDEVSCSVPPHPGSFEKFMVLRTVPAAEENIE
jgi:hypothetical protein